MGTELEPEDDEIEVLEKAMKERASHKTTTQKDIEQNPESALPATPFPFARYKAFRISTLCIVFTYVLTMFTLLYIYISQTSNASSLFLQKEATTIFIGYIYWDSIFVW